MHKKILFGLLFFLQLTLLPAWAAKAAEPADTAITDGINRELYETMNWPLNNNAIEVVTEDGTVYLRGKVADVAHKSQAEAIARDTPGVRKVVNELEVYEQDEK